MGGASEEFDVAERNDGLEGEEGLKGLEQLEEWIVQVSKAPFDQVSPGFLPGVTFCAMIPPWCQVRC